VKTRLLRGWKKGVDKASESVRHPRMDMNYRPDSNAGSPEEGRLRINDRLTGKPFDHGLNLVGRHDTQPGKKI
jgi:hypothetical protein